ncbi:bifunctional phosphopantothenoylcysteine decarboxylase/phosphopantothenate--cysteine ligase CoaBC [Arenimonas sp. MALMAid1274]|uniref:bifunctional phosphopantothenoylcysteine decarboxylase/phosphopantothenate--cysteine ligase CoaBC n=1 Tax=Arenimonas sp. MALMAid1274 TaxID=3411630 RepID=UPI003BA16535
MPFTRVGKTQVAGLEGQRILLGVSGGIAAYKAAEVLRRLQDEGAQVRVVMTASALHFVGPTTFQALSRQPVRSSLWDEAAEAAMGHIELARWATRILVVPATANVIARLAQGRANDLLSTLCLASEAPLTLAPAMNRVMWAHPATQANVATLVARGVELIGPAEGDQACGEVGAGRLVEPDQIVAALVASARPGRLAGKRVLVSAGPTFEDIDPVRFIGNRSSGKMGFAVAAAARALGAEVTLVAGPVSLATPAGVRRIDVRRAAQMRDAVLGELAGHDVYLGAAAVADYAPARTMPQKIKKSGETMALELVRTADILAEVAAHPQRPALVVGFAAETQDMEAYARDKLQRKGLDMIAANDVARAGQGFECDDNALSVFWHDGRRDIPHGSKPRVARDLMALVADRLEGGK